MRLHEGEGRPLKCLIAKVGKWAVRIIYCILVMWECDLSSALGSLVLKKLKFLFVLLLEKKNTITGANSGKYAREVFKDCESIRC